MNRAERRKYKGGIPPEELNQIIRKEQARLDAELAEKHKEIINDAVSKYSVAIMLILRDKLGFGRIRIQRFMQDVEETFDAINEDYVSFEDMKQTLTQELGVEVKEGR